MKLKRNYKANSVRLACAPPPLFLETKNVLKTYRNVNFKRTVPVHFITFLTSVKYYKET